MKKIFIVTSGCYSDYQIDAVYSSKEKASEFVNIQGSNYRIEEYILDPELPEKEDTWWEVILLCNTKEVQCASKTPETFWNKDTIRYVCFHNMRDGDYYGIIINVRADSQQKAIKVASERYGVIIAYEQTMYPLLRAKIIYDNYPIYDFNTGEILCSNEEDRKKFPPFVKFKDISDLQ